MNRSQSKKRKLPIPGGLQRRVRARKEEPEAEEFEGFSESSGEDQEEDDDALAAGSSEDGNDASEDEATSEGDNDESEEEEDTQNPSINASQISFGALAKAQASLPSARRKPNQQSASDSDSDSSSDSAPEEASSAKKPAHRSSKHAPTEQSARRAVSRKREVIAVPKLQSRDPRFGPLGGGGQPANEAVLRKNYAFLSSYRDSEMATLKATIKKTKDASAKEELQRALMSMQSRKQAQQRKDAEREVVAEHRRREKELVRQGKTPFYLKKSETKKRMLTERFEKMGKGKADKAIERRRKKLASRERRDMPLPRRRGVE